LILLICYCADEGSSFNWTDILSVALYDSTITIKETTPDEFSIFHMSSYMLDMMYVHHQYPKMSWMKWPTKPPMHIYCKVLWDHKYRTRYHRIFDYFLAPLYEINFDSPTPCMTNKALEIVRKIGYWYLMDNVTYIRVYESTKDPYILPRFINDKLVLQEIAYQIEIHGAMETLYCDKKAIWPPSPLWVKLYSFGIIK
jgi:hypothetical protein